VLAEEHEPDGADEEEREHHGHAGDGMFGPRDVLISLVRQCESEDLADEGHDDHRHADHDDEEGRVSEQDPELVAAQSHRSRDREPRRR
jgi:hypothetical protein